jgi:hypothetical protein
VSALPIPRDGPKAARHEECRDVVSNEYHNLNHVCNEEKGILAIKLRLLRDLATPDEKKESLDFAYQALMLALIYRAPPLNAVIHTL